MNITPGEKWVLVTGGSRGIGRGIVQSLPEDGLRVIFTYRVARDEARDLEHASCGYARGEQVDGTDYQAVSSFAERTLAQHGPPYAVINNAGITRDGALMASSQESWMQVVDSNMNAMFHMTRAFLPAMIGVGSGSVVQMSSVTAIKGNSGQAGYAATKAGMLGFTRTLAHEVARFGVRVNAVLPGLIETDMTRNMSDQARKSLNAMVPMRRIGLPSEIADCVRFLISDRASYITGQGIVVDGGLSA